MPIFGFGENETYNQIEIGSVGSWVFKLRAKFYKWSTIWLPVPYARGIMPNSVGIFPNKQPVTVMGNYYTTHLLHLLTQVFN